MRKRVYALVGMACLGVLAACGPGMSANGERTLARDLSAEVTPSVNAASTPTQVWVYDNPHREEDLPEKVPIVVSFKGQEPSVAFRIGCGSEYPLMLEGFGYARDLDLETVDAFGSWQDVDERLKQLAAGQQVPIHTLRCGPSKEALRNQILQVYRLIDDDPEKDPASPYLVRFRDDADTAIYSLECQNLLTALSWSGDDGRGLEQLSIPINQEVYEFWKDQGLEPREIHCHPRTRKELPPVRAQLPLHPPEAEQEGPVRLFKVARRFDGISSAKVLYLISGGKGYALDCNARQDELKSALGIDSSAPVEELSTSDPRFVASKPGQQPILRCDDANLTLFESLNEPPGARYVRFGKDTRLVRFSCPETSTFFSGGATNVRRVPKEALPHLLIDPNASEARTPLLSVGCNGPSQAELNQLRAWFFEVFGRAPSASEGILLRVLHARARFEAPSDPAAVARAVLGELESRAKATELDPLIQRAVEQARVKPATEVDVNQHTLRDYLKDKVLGRFGAPERAHFTQLKRFIEERTPRLEARWREHYLSTFGAIPTPGLEKAFHRELMEAPEDPARFEAIQLPANQSLVADQFRLLAVVLKAIQDGKVANRAHPNLDGGTVGREDATFFMQDILKSQQAPLKTGIYKWVRDRVANSHAAPESELIASYNHVFGCGKGRGEFGPCPSPEGLASWKASFYAPGNQDADFSLARLIQGHENYLKGCAAQGASCKFELDNILARACSSRGVKCESNTRAQEQVADFIRRGWLCPNFKSIECYVRTGSRINSDRFGCHYPTIDGGVCP